MSVRHVKFAILLLVAAAALVAIALQAPIPQPSEYHGFADQRRLLGVPNFWNVASNLPFLIVGLLGLRALWRGPTPGVLPALRPAYLCFFLGSALVALGSGYYHLAPDNAALVWDRLPMTVAFMAFFSILLGEQVDPRLGRLSLLPLLLLGAASVVYWHLTESAGHGDLRPYAIVQFVPILLAPLLLLLFRSALTDTRLVWAVLAAYLAAKLLEEVDGVLFEQLGAISGHSLKHVVAAIGVYFMVRAVRQRRAVQAAGQSADPAGATAPVEPLKLAPMDLHR